jgi:hypothetical protein
LNPTVPAEAHAMTLPFGSVIEMTVLLEGAFDARGQPRRSSSLCGAPSGGRCCGLQLP